MINVSTGIHHKRSLPKHHVHVLTNNATVFLDQCNVTTLSGDSFAGKEAVFCFLQTDYVSFVLSDKVPPTLSHVVYIALQRLEVMNHSMGEVNVMDIRPQ